MIHRLRSVFEQGALAMRKKLGLYANIRPVVTFETLIHKSPLRADLVKGADFMCIRELTGDFILVALKVGRKMVTWHMILVYIVVMRLSEL